MELPDAPLQGHITQDLILMELIPEAEILPE